MKKLFLICFFTMLSETLLVGSQAQIEMKKKVAVSQTVNTEVDWDEIAQFIGSSVVQTEELWIRIFFPDMQQIEKFREEVKKIILAQECKLAEIISYRMFYATGQFDKGKDTSVNAPFSLISPVGVDQLILVGLSNGELGWFWGKALHERYRKIQCDQSIGVPLTNLLLVLDKENNVLGRVPKLSEEQTRFFYTLPSDIQANMRSNYKFQLAQNQEQVAKMAAAAVAVSQSTSSTSSASAPAQAAQSQQQQPQQQPQQQQAQNSGGGQDQQPNQQPAAQQAPAAQPQPQPQAASEEGFSWGTATLVVGGIVLAVGTGYGAYLLYYWWVA